MPTTDPNSTAFSVVSANAKQTTHVQPTNLHGAIKIAQCISAHIPGEFLVITEDGTTHGTAENGAYRYADAVPFEATPERITIFPPELLGPAPISPAG